MTGRERELTEAKAEAFFDGDRVLSKLEKRRVEISLRETVQSKCFCRSKVVIGGRS